MAVPYPAVVAVESRRHLDLAAPVRQEAAAQLVRQNLEVVAEAMQIPA